MAKTGTYKWDPKLKQVVKVSDDIPRLRKPVWFPTKGHKLRTHEGYFDEHLNETFIRNKEHKRRVMDELYAEEAG